MIEQELARIDTILEQSIACIESGKLKEAGRLSSKLNGSWAVSEACRAQAIIDGYILLTRKKPTQAKKRCLSSICYLWDNLDGLYLIRQPHAQPSATTRWYELHIKGGCASLGGFTVFTEEHSSSFLVVADDEFEAVRYIEEIAQYAENDKKILLSVQTKDIVHDDSVDRKGVYRCSPFSTTASHAGYLEQLASR